MSTAKIEVNILTHMKILIYLPPLYSLKLDSSLLYYEVRIEMLKTFNRVNVLICF